MIIRINARKHDSAETGPPGPIVNAVCNETRPIKSIKLPMRPTLKKYMLNVSICCQYQVTAIIILIEHITPTDENVRVVASNFIFSPERCLIKITYIANKLGHITPNKTGIQGDTRGFFKSYLKVLTSFISAKLIQRADTIKLKMPIK